MNAEASPITHHAGNAMPLAVRPAEAAKLLSISERALSDLIASDPSFPRVRLGSRCVLIPVDELRRWLASSCERAEGGAL